MRSGAYPIQQSQMRGIQPDAVHNSEGLLTSLPGMDILWVRGSVMSGSLPAVDSVIRSASFIERRITAMEKEGLRIKSVCEYEGRFWTVPGSSDALYCIDPVRREKECVCHLGYEGEEVRYYTCADKNIIWGVSEYRKLLRVFSYEPKGKKLEFHESARDEGRNYVSVIYNGIIYSFFESLSLGCLCFDTDKKEFFEDKTWTEALKMRGIDGKILSHFFDGENIFFTLYKSSYLLHYNLRTKEILLIDVGEELHGIIAKDNIIYCILAGERAVFFFDTAAGTSNKIYGPSAERGPYLRIFKMGDQILLLDEEGLDCLGGEGEIRRVEVPGGIIRRYPRGSLFAVSSFSGNVNYLFPYSAGIILAFAEDGTVCDTCSLDFTEKDMRQMDLHRLFCKGIVGEDKDVSIESLLEYVALQEPG